MRPALDDVAAELREQCHEIGQGFAPNPETGVDEPVLRDDGARV